ncbi:MAG TPA: OmpA family protein [Terriglobales bacterium]|nr:OmpA family protein [Terriglobales bacterium]
MAKGAAAITTTRSKCTTRLSVNADALFQPHRWTLNPDAPETLDALGPKIVQAGKYPAHIVAYTDASDSEAENRDVSQRRALTVRTWLINHRFVPDDISIQKDNPDKPVAPAEKSTSRDERPHNNGLVSVIVDTCP